MAKRAKKSTKETSDALSAVEEALKIDFGQEASADVADELYGRSSEPSIDRSGSSTGNGSRDVLSPSAPAANDERGSGSARFAAALSRRCRG